ncbi:DUF6966 domain-containing protein [Gilliamella sp. B2838]|uniref:DUF6966 domain-containing protein n=1 Tax=Gilliamella sp. B2838 TaxID=2818020 RepID=UPI002269940B|nr:hypothetical protein [Gilliamella sp. B2838]MCX8728669.1 hypothetical protein [Gilliamella sp. B2838]
MMNNIEKIKEILVEISTLLIKGNYPDWGNSFIKFSKEIESDPEFIKSELSKLYGGMGSFNDIVLYEDRKPLIDENDRLYFLRTQLFELINH